VSAGTKKTGLACLGEPPYLLPLLMRLNKETRVTLCFIVPCRYSCVGRDVLGRRVAQTARWAAGQGCRDRCGVWRAAAEDPGGVVGWWRLWGNSHKPHTYS